jgi:serine phosphatase RsbU (regulator of sigma subunit)/pSer/pThr/pTyr-binding forkhead associated (FHA) protein
LRHDAAKSLRAMDNTAADVILEVHCPDGSTRKIRLAETPYLIGRGEDGNHFPIADDHVSRKCASIVFENHCYCILDRGNSRGVFVNGGKVSKQPLDPGDVITFGSGVPYSIVFQSKVPETQSIKNPVTHAGPDSGTNVSQGLERLNLLLEATQLLHSRSPLETVLNAMLDRAITVTGADRALLLEADSSGSMQPRVARGSGSRTLALKTFTPSGTALNTAIEQEAAVITQNLDSADPVLQGARSIVDQRLLSVVAIPLYAKERGAEGESSATEKRRLLGIMYLDSKKRTAFSTLDRQILDAIAIASASIMENARLAKIAQEQQRVERELNIARGIQQALLPQGPREFPHLAISGVNKPCYEVGGDYFDIFPLNDNRVAFLIADVSGKGLGAALVTTMLQGAFSGVTTGSDPGRIFQHINTFLCDHSEVQRHATLFFGTLDGSGNLEYLNAGHPSPLVMQGGVVQELFKGGSLPLGLLPGIKYPVNRKVLDPGGTLVLFSDGITEAESRHSEFFGESRLQNVLVGQQETALDVLQNGIIKAVETFAEGTRQGDDITIMLVRYRTALL